MCDTLGFVSGGRGLFAKNSDRSPNEAQIIEYHDALMHFTTLPEISYREGKPVTTLKKDMLRTSYTEVDEVKETHAVLLSRPAWMWGAEMGVNDCGVCMGNEAVFTKGGYGKTGLTGMELLRLALERSADAKSALDCTIELLERYGQGGNCGYDHEFYYDNAFLIMDTESVYVLDTFHKEWAWKKYERATISNRLTLGADGDGYSGERCDFASKYSDVFFSFGSMAKKRQNTTARYIEKAGSVSDMMSALREHNAEKPFASGTVASPCMHFGGLVGDHTTSSMVADVTKERSIIWVTGSSCPCVSLFKPWLFGTKPVAPVYSFDDGESEYYWRESEKFRRSIIGRTLPEEYYLERDELQNKWIEDAESCAGEDFPLLSGLCLEKEREFFARWGKYDFPEISCAPGFKKRWEKKNKIFEKEGSKSEP